MAFRLHQISANEGFTPQKWSYSHLPAAAPLARFLLSYT